jgi:hypothetical protein
VRSKFDSKLKDLALFEAARWQAILSGKYWCFCFVLVDIFVDNDAGTRCQGRGSARRGAQGGGLWASLWTKMLRAVEM